MQTTCATHMRDRAGKAARGWPPALRLRRSGLRPDCPAVLGSRACGITRCVHFVHCAQTNAASQTWKRAARAGPEACAPRRRKVAPPATRPRLRLRPRDVRATQDSVLLRKGVAGQRAQRLCGAEERRASSQRAQRASTSDLRHLFERSERSERSELCRRLRDRAPQGSRPAGSTAAVEAESAARPRLCALGAGDRATTATRIGLKNRA